MRPWRRILWHHLILIPFCCFHWVLPTELCCIAANQRYTCKLLSEFSSSMVQFSSKNPQDHLALISVRINNFIMTDQHSISKLSSIISSTNSFCRHWTIRTPHLCKTLGSWYPLDRSARLLLGPQWCELLFATYMLYKKWLVFFCLFLLFLSLFAYYELKSELRKNTDM